MDLTESIAPKSDQINAEDLLSGPRTFTIEKVTKGSAEQPFNFHLTELPGRPYRPSKTMRRVMVDIWGAEASAYAGRQLTLYRDPSVRFGGQPVGGIKISHMSGIKTDVELWLTETRGKRAKHTVKPLVATPPAPSAEDVAACTDRDQLKAWWQHTHLQPQIRARVAELDALADPGADQ